MPKDAESTIERIIQVFRRGENKPRTAKEGLERLDEELKKSRRVTLSCSNCGKPLAWFNPNGSFSEVSLHPPKPKGGFVVGCSPGEYCPSCGAEVKRRGKYFDEGKRFHQDFEVIY